MKNLINLALVLSIVASILVLFFRNDRNHHETRAQQLARYRQEDARDTALQGAYDRNQKILQALWKDKCPNGKDPAVPICADGPPEYLPITYFWGHTLEPMR